MYNDEGKKVNDLNFSGLSHYLWKGYFHDENTVYKNIKSVIPGEVICKEGDAGDSMFFISSGALSVNLKDGAVTLGSGEFFGEIALLKETPRVATVAANSFCELLVLRKADFEELLVKSPQLKEEIEKVAAARLS